MDLANSGEVLDVSEPPQQEESVMEKEVLSKLETPEEPTEPEKPPAADGEIEQLPVNGHDAEVINETETEELNVTETVTLSEERTEMEIEDSPPIEPSDMESEPVAVAPPEPDESSEKIPDPEAENTQPQEQPEPENDLVPVQAPLEDMLPEPEQPSESVPEAEQELTPPEPEAVQLMNTEPLIQEEKVSELVDTETQQQTPMDTEAEAAEPLKEAKEENPAEMEKLVENLKTLEVQEEVEQISELMASASPEKPAEMEKIAETVLVADVSPEKPAETEKIVETVVVADVSPEKPAETEKLVETVLATEIQTELVPDKSPEKPAETEKVADTVPLASVSPEKPAEPVTLKEEAVAENEIVKPAEEEKKEVEQEKSIVPETLKGAEIAAAGDSDNSETKVVEAEKEEETVPASGSLSFALLEQEQTKDALRISRTLVILRGLPGSGKSFLARAIADTYKDHCSVLSADEHGVKPESLEASVDGYKALDDAVVACCGAAASSVLVVVDDTNHTQDRLAHLGEIAEQHHLVAVFLEPRTEWSSDPAQLTKKTRRGLEVAQLEAMKGPLSEMSIPLFFGWFLLSSVQEKVRCTSMDFLKTLDTLETFKKHLSDFTGKAEKEVDLEQYFQAKGALHCTTKFCNYGKAEGAKEYADNQAVKDLYGSVSELSLSALFVTPRTVGARVSLTEEQLTLWPADAEKEADVPAAASLPRGSRAHITLGCAEGVEPVQTGLDLLEILALQQEGQQGELVEEMELGSLTYYGSGRWLLSLREPIGAPACFSSYYGRKESEPAKKEPERRRNKKCTIL